MDPGVVQMQQLLFYVIALPAAGATLNGLVGHRLPRSLVGLIGCAAPAGAFICAVRLFCGLLGLRHDAAHLLPGQPLNVTTAAFSWLVCGPVHLDVRLCADPLAAVMMLVITGVGTLIHIYSLGYMAHEPAFARYFIYLNLFMAAMLLLVLGDSLPLMFVGWEGVGLMSYLLIGFWFTDNDKAAAGKKAFIINRIGDLGFICAMLVLFRFVHDLSFSGLAAAAASGSISTPVASAACLLLILGATGKSAQIPLFVWLPDAMAGPTPVSALMHAATMVTAGVYLVARLSFVFVLAPSAMLTLACLGAASALVAASIATVQNDIKKVLAYSTISQLGFMFMAAGVGAFGVAIFHVVMHAFFKACLFLGAGCVIHGLGGEQDMRQMGGLRGHMPVTFWMMLLSTLAITGIPFFSGFVSKDAILSSVLASAQGPQAATFGQAAWAIWGVGITAAALTSFYMWRLMFMTFFSGKPRQAAAAPGVHEAPSVMLYPTMVLAAAATVGGVVGWPPLLGGHDWLGQWLNPVHGHGSENNSLAWLSIAIALGATLAGAALAYALYARRIHPVTHRLAAGGLWHGLYTAAVHQWYIDALYEALIVRPWIWVSRVFLFEGVDKRLIGGVVDGVAWALRSVGFIGQLFHSGNIQRYLAIFVVGLSLLLYGWLNPGPHLSVSPPISVLQSQGGVPAGQPLHKGPRP